MSLSTVDAPSTLPSASRSAVAAKPKWFWARVLLMVVLVGASAGVRWVRASRYADLIEAGELPPFPMDEIPMVIGPWKGEDAKLDSDVARVTGASGIASRIYTDGRTGVKLSVIVLYGPASKVYIHSPEVCYPSSGFRLVEGPLTQKIPVGDKKVPFASLLYEKGFGSVRDRRQVYYTWHHGGAWTPAMPVHKKVERVPGMFKVHIERRAGMQEQIDLSDPCIDFLKLLMVDLQRRIDLATSQGTGVE
jgi:EpsI family protein